MAESHVAHTALAHHFDNMEQQREAGTLGMWTFLITEIMFFGGLFMAYILYRSRYPYEFAVGSSGLDWALGGINTAVLIFSSLTMALAVYYSQVGSRKLLITFLLITMALGSVFLGIKAVEYKHKFEHHLFPGLGFKWEAEHRSAQEGRAQASVEQASVEQPVSEQAGHAPTPATSQSAHSPASRSVDSSKVQMFYWIYFAMTGVHALHMIIGIGILAVLVFMAYRGRFTREYHSPIEISGLYWHFVDIIWIFLFPLLYLIGRHV